MGRLVVVSNRVAVATDTKAKAGGLAVALQDALRRKGGVWFGWSGKTGARTPLEPKITDVGKVRFATLDLSKKDYEEYYNGYANRTLWPLFHYRLDLTAFTKQDYSGYLRVNTLFAHALAPLIEDSDTLWIHDYHLIPLGDELRRMGIEQPMGFFLHTPFPALEILTALPHHAKLIEDLCAYDLIGFQTVNDLRAFQDYIVHEAGGGLMADNRVHAFGRTLRAEVFPIGIDTADFEVLGKKAGRTALAKRLDSRASGVRRVIGVDRLDYSKGIYERLQAFEHFLDLKPHFRGNVQLTQIAPPSRAEVPEYMEITRTLETEAGRINGRLADFEWVPVNYLNQNFKRQDLAVFYRKSAAALVTPLRDGMNLVAKEYVAAQNPDDPGVLVLSRFAGAAREMDVGALIVNPFDYEGMAEAIATAMDMPVEERRDRWLALMAVLRGNTLDDWRDRFLDTLAQAPFQ